MSNVINTSVKHSLLAKFKQRALSERIVYIFVFVIFTCFALSYLYILFWGFMSGLKTHSEIALHPLDLPIKPQFKNYVDVFSLLKIAGFDFFGMTMNSLYFSMVGPFLSCMVSAMLGYVTAKYKFPGAKWYLIVTTFTMSLPIYGNAGSMYQLIYNLGLINSYSLVITAVGSMNMTYLLFHAAFSNLSWSYAEAAFIDGAGDYTVFFRVMLPQVLNIFGALFLLAWVADWNNYSWTLLYLRKLPTLSAGIYLFELDMVRVVRRDILYAAYTITVIPPLILFVVFNKALTSNLSLGGIKE